MLPAVFDSASVRAVFEDVTGVRLEREDTREYDQLRATHPVGPSLPALTLYNSPKHSNDRFGGRFTVRIYIEGNVFDEVVCDDGLERYLPERGPQVYRVSAGARRANVEVMFSGDTGEITPEAQAVWALLTSCLHRL